MADMESLGADPIRCVLLLSYEDAAGRGEKQQAWLEEDPIPGLLPTAAQRYVRSVPLASGQRGFNPREIFGVAQAWIDGFGAAQRVCRDLASLPAGPGAGVLQGCTATAIPMRDQVVIDGPERPGGGDGIKALFFARRKPGMTVAAFQAHWRDVHGPLVPGTPGLERYVQCHPCPEAYGDLPPAYDSMAELTFAGEAGLAAFNGPSEQRSAQGADLPNLWDMTVRTPRIYIQDRA